MKMKGFIFGKNGIMSKKTKTAIKRRFGRNKKKYGEKSILRSINTRYALVEKKDEKGNVYEVVCVPISDRKKMPMYKKQGRIKLVSFLDT